MGQTGHKQQLVVHPNFDAFAGMEKKRAETQQPATTTLDGTQDGSVVALLEALQRAGDGFAFELVGKIAPEKLWEYERGDENTRYEVGGGWGLH